MPSKREQDGVAYGEAYMKYSPEETSAEFRKIVNMVPWDILRYVTFLVCEFCQFIEKFIFGFHRI